MSESREYYSRSEEYGDVYISEEVLEMIAGAAALEVEGVTGLAGGTVSEQLLGRKKLSKGITILWESDNITINVIKDGNIIEKKKLKLPKKIIGLAKCKNPRCITSAEPGLKHEFILTDPENRVYRCRYCEEKYEEEKA